METIKWHEFVGDEKKTGNISDEYCTRMQY